MAQVKKLPAFSKENSQIHLQNLCLSVITENIDRYCALLKMSNNKLQRKNLEFLERRFSENIFCRLKDKRRLKRRHLDLLINRYTKELNIVGIEQQLLPCLTDRLKEHGSSILYFKARGQDSTSDLHTVLMSMLPNVEEIDYLHERLNFQDPFDSWREEQHNEISQDVPRICKIIGENCPSLKCLKFEINDIRAVKKYNNGVACILRRCPHLEDLQYRDTAGVLHMLHESDLRSTKSAKKSTSSTRTNYAFKSLSSKNRDYNLCDALKICAARCPYVSSLDVDYVKNDELDAISNIPLLKDIKFQLMRDVSRSCLEKFLKLRGSELTSMDMSSGPVFRVQILIESCPKLRNLKLRNVQLDASGENCDPLYKECLSELRTLEFSFVLFRAPSSVSALKILLSSAKNLKTLLLTSTYGLTNEFFSSLKLCDVSVLGLSSSDVKVEALKGLLSNENLQEMDIRYCKNLSYDDYVSLTEFTFNSKNKVQIKWCPDRSSVRQRIISCFRNLPR